MSPWLGAALIVLMVAFVTFLASIRMVQEYERAVVFRFGRLLRRPKRPGYSPVTRSAP